MDHATNSVSLQVVMENRLIKPNEIPKMEV